MERLHMISFRLDTLKCQLTHVAVEHTQRGDHPYYRHRHNAYEMHHILAGSCSFGVGNQIFQVTAGQSCVIQAGTYHAIKDCSADLDKMCISMEVLNREQEQSLECQRILEGLGRSSFQIFTTKGMASCMENLRLACLENRWKLGWQLEMELLCAAALLEIGRGLDRKTGEEPAPVEDALDLQRSYWIDEFFNANFQRQDGDALLAKELCVSIRQLNRILNKLYGMGFREKLMEIRLEVALDLLHTSDLSIAKISELTGYSCSANFSTFIKSQTGQTPTAIRGEKRR